MRKMRGQQEENVRKREIPAEYKRKKRREGDSVREDKKVNVKALLPVNWGMGVTGVIRKAGVEWGGREGEGK